MVRLRSLAGGAGAALLLVAAVGGRAEAQHGSLTATLVGHRATPTSDTLSLRIALRMTPGWHIGAAQPGVTGVPTKLTWRVPAGWRIVASHWPAPTPTLVGRDTAFEYRGPFAIQTTLVADRRRTSGLVEAVLSYGICRDVCIPGRLKLTYEIP